VSLGSAVQQTRAVPPTERPRRAARRALAVLALLAAAWAVPLLAGLLRVDWLLPPLVLAGTASLLRGGRTLLDRLMLALALLLGLTCGAGVVLSVLPWGMSPVPLAGGALTGLVLIGMVLRRRPRLSRRVTWSDGGIVATGLAAAAVIWFPYAGHGLGRRLALNMLGEDYARHFSVFDTIRRVGGYTNEHAAAAAPYLRPGMSQYPQGSHFLAALLDNFARSSTALGGPVRSYDHYLALSVGSYALFAMALVWALRWVGGPRLRGLPAVASGALVAALAVGGYPVGLWQRGFTAQLVGLLVVTLLVAVLLRPGRRAEYPVLVACLVVGVGFTYYLYLPLALLGVLLSVLVHRRRVRRVLPLAVVTALVAAPFALYWPVRAVLSGTTPEELTTGGAVPALDRGMVLALFVVVVAAALAGGGHRLAAHRAAAALLTAAAGSALAVGAYQYLATGHTAYYFVKLLHPAVVVGLVALGIPALVLRRHGTDARTAGAAPSRRRWERLLGAAAVLAALLFVGLPLPRSQLSPSDWGRTWMSQPGQWQGGLVAAVVRRYPGGDGTIVLKVGSGGYDNYLASLYISVLRRDDGVAWRPIDELLPQVDPELLTDRARGLESLVARSPRPVRYVVTDDQLRAELAGYAAAHPELRMSVVPAPAGT
jgi:hypothetical protein